MRESVWFQELRERYAQDPEALSEELLLAITERLCQEQQQQGLTLKQWAEKAGTSSRRLLRFLRFDHPPTVLAVVQYAAALGLEVRLDFALMPGERGQSDEQAEPVATR